MNRSFTLGVVGLLATFGSVYGAVPGTGKGGDDESHLFRFDFNCQFTVDCPTPTPSPTSKPGLAIAEDAPKTVQCTALARVFDWVSTQGSDMWGSGKQASNLANLMAVECDGNLFMASGATLNSTQDRVELFASNGKRVEIEIPRTSKDGIKQDWTSFKATLTVGKSHGEG